MESNNCPHKKLTNRASWMFCDDCKTHIAKPADLCRECNGRGFKQRMTSIYSGVQGKKYRCGQCKGTGTIKPIPCVKCAEPSVMEVSNIMRVDGTWMHRANVMSLTSFCQSCYNHEATQ